MDHQTTTRTTMRATAWSLASNVVLAAIKWIGGIAGHSNALIADAIESTTDIFSSLLVLLGLRYAARPADEGHPYGHGRVEPLITFLVDPYGITFDSGDGAPVAGTSVTIIDEATGQP